jgi:putative ribosome biogenesis GTPase RsgA
VNGPKGAGKSSVVNSVIANQSFGVMSLSLQSSDTDLLKDCQRNLWI